MSEQPASTATTPDPDAITRWLINSFEPDYLLVMARQLIAYALAAKGEAGFAPGEPTENLGEWSEDEQT
jgi:hypothetical protein